MATLMPVQIIPYFSVTLLFSYLAIMRSVLDFLIAVSG